MWPFSNETSKKIDVQTIRIEILEKEISELKKIIEKLSQKSETFEKDLIIMYEDIGSLIDDQISNLESKIYI
jgi:predicted RNase H-like nuclease (RuvC/YqgF family)